MQKKKVDGNMSRPKQGTRMDVYYPCFKLSQSDNVMG